MVNQQEMNLVQVPPLILKAAQLIRSFSRQEKAYLLQLVPELRTISTDEDRGISVEQRELIAYFEQKIDTYPVTQNVQSKINFLDNLTLDEFLTLNEPEQAHLWSNAHSKASEELEDYEHKVREDAIST